MSQIDDLSDYFLPKICRLMNIQNIILTDITIDFMDNIIVWYSDSDKNINRITYSEEQWKNL